MKKPIILTVRSGDGEEILDQRQCNDLGDALTLVGNARAFYGATRFGIVDSDGVELVRGETQIGGVQELHPTVVPHPAACTSPAAVKRLERSTGMVAVVRDGIARFARRGN